MKKRFLLTICCCIAIALSTAVAAQASTTSTINFDFTRHYDSGTNVLIDSSILSFGRSFSYIENDVTLTATATSGGSTSWVNWTPNGLGVSSGWFDNTQIDGWGPDDMLLLSFGEDVIVNSIKFTLVGCDDDFRFLVDGDTLIPAADIPVGGIYDFTLQPTGRPKGMDFGITVTEKNDDYKIAGMEVEISNVPIPAAGLLFVSSMLGMLGLRKKRQC